MSNSTSTDSLENSDELSRITTVTIIMVSITFVAFFIYLFSRFEFERGRIVVLDAKTSRGSKMAWIALLILSWYTISSLFLLSNKWILSDAGSTSLPLSIAFVHMTLKGFVAAIVWTFRRSSETIDSRGILSNLRVVLIGTMTSLDIGFSNWAIVFVSVTTYTIFKSGILLVTFAMCVVLGYVYRKSPSKQKATHTLHIHLIA